MSKRREKEETYYIQQPLIQRHTILNEIERKGERERERERGRERERERTGYRRHYIEVKKISTTATGKKKVETVDPDKASVLTVPRGNRWCDPNRRIPWV